MMGKTARIRKLACPRAVKQEFHSLLLLLLLLYFFSKGFYLQRTYMLKYFKGHCSVFLQTKHERSESIIFESERATEVSDQRVNIS